MTSEHFVYLGAEHATVILATPASWGSGIMGQRDQGPLLLASVVSPLMRYREFAWTAPSFKAAGAAVEIINTKTHMHPFTARPALKSAASTAFRPQHCGLEA